MSHAVLFRRLVAGAVLLACGLPALVAGDAPSPGSFVRLTATGHAMQYWLSLPKNWDAQHEWPVLVVLEAAEKDYEANARRFAAARGDLPFIIVAPYIVTNGNQGLRDPRIFPYDPATWNLIDRVTPCAFDLEGLDHVIADVGRDFHGRAKVCLTGFEAGTHLLWAYTFRHPEKLAAAVPVAGNYRGRCVDDAAFSADPARESLPIHAMTGEQDALFRAGGRLYPQYLEARTLAQQHGFRNLTEEVVPGKDHVPLPAEVLAYLVSLGLTR